VLEENVLSHMKNIALPYLDKLKESGLNAEQRSFVQVLEKSLYDLTSPMARTLTSKTLDLTPTELQVADLIKHGKRTKEIAEMLHLSTNTIVSHRYIHSADKKNRLNQHGWIKINPATPGHKNTVRIFGRRRGYFHGKKSNGFSLMAQCL